VAQVPLAESSGSVTGVREHFGHCDFPLHEAVDRSIDRHRAVTRANCVRPSHQSGTAGRALRLDVEVKQAHPLCRQLVDSRGRCAAQNPPAVDPGLSPTKVVHQHKDDIWLLLRIGVHLGFSLRHAVELFVPRRPELSTSRTRGHSTNRVVASTERCTLTNLLIVSRLVGEWKCQK
jgi:hypothetical protein